MDGIVKLMESPWFLSGLGLSLAFLLLTLTYRAGYAKGISPVNQVIDESGKVIQQLHSRVVLLQAENETLRKRCRLQLETIERLSWPAMPVRQERTPVQRHYDDVAKNMNRKPGGVHIIDGVPDFITPLDGKLPPAGDIVNGEGKVVGRAYQGGRLHETCGDPECPHCGMEKPR